MTLQYLLFVLLIKIKFSKVRSFTAFSVKPSNAPNFSAIEESDRNIRLSRITSCIQTRLKDQIELRAVGREENNDDFWDQQKDLAASLIAGANKEDLKLKREMTEKYEKRLVALISDTFFFSILIFCFLWALAISPATPLSYLFGAILGTAYSYGLGKYVQTIGGSVEEKDSVEGAGVGSARFAFLILLFIFVGKFRSNGLQEIPSIVGFFTYQLASLSQGLREIND